MMTMMPGRHHNARLENLQLSIGYPWEQQFGSCILFEKISVLVQATDCHPYHASAAIVLLPTTLQLLLQTCFRCRPLHDQSTDRVPLVLPHGSVICRLQRRRRCSVRVTTTLLHNVSSRCKTGLNALSVLIWYKRRLKSGRHLGSLALVDLADRGNLPTRRNGRGGCHRSGTLDHHRSMQTVQMLET
jgi:hypothetical protein